MGVVDWYAYPGYFEFFTIIRMIVNAFVVYVLWRYRLENPRLSEWGICLGIGGQILAMVWVTGGPSSDYYVGLMILFLGIPVFSSLSWKDASIISGLFCLGFALTPAAVEVAENAGGSRFAVSLFFLMAGACESGVSSALLQGARLRDFQQRQRLQRASENLKELDRQKSRFTANIHHELRTPLTLTLAPVEAMLSGEFGEISDLQRGYLKTIQSNALRLLKLINNLLDLAKIEGQQLQVQRRPVRLQDLVEEIVSGAMPLAQRKGVGLGQEGLDSLPVVNADPEAVEKIAVNLLGNALKFTDRGGRIEVRGRAEEGGGVHLVVSDTGAGIPADQLERVFDRFAQVDTSSTRKHEGTGIGLALVKELVDLHGGRIWAESEGLGRGTEMHVVLPEGESDLEGESAIADAVLEGEDTTTQALGNRIAAMGAELELDEDAPGAYSDALRTADFQRNVERSEGETAPIETPALPEHPPETPEVLVVEDNVDMRRLLAFLVGQEFRLRLARNGREGLEAVRQRAPDLVLTDVMMPEMSGTELCEAIKRDADLAAIPVVLVTSKAERQMKIEGLELGADDYVTKPFHPRELLARVRALVKLRRAQQELAVRNALLESTNEELHHTMEELKEASAQLVHAERLAAVGELAAGVAHEVNNPVNFAMNAAKALSATVDDVRQVAEQVAAIDPGDSGALRQQIQALESLRETLHFDDSAATLAELTGIVNEGLSRTAALVGDLRDFAAPGEREKGPVDVTRGLRTTLRLMGHSLVRAGIEAHVEIPAGLPPVQGDGRALNQVFLNLLKNAAEAFEGRAGSIHVRARSEGGFVAVEIRDDGPGVPAALQDQLFQPFFTTKESGRGSGLGLSISRRIVQEHGGTLELTSVPGDGARVVVRLPVDPDARGPETGGSAPPRPEAPRAA